ncbi:unnamed protein product [Somion occarium]|uniref:Uncharacterized protein n=1 Tax=Somion occarium TaxID=3059160 RepID=A0ABP1DEI0_9APHY
MHAHYNAPNCCSTSRVHQSHSLIRIPGNALVDPHPLPLYNRQPSQRAVRHFTKPTPLSGEDLMKTVDYSFVEPPSKHWRTSLALSDIFEEDEVQIEISEVLPSPSTHESSGLPNNHKKVDISARIKDFIHFLRDKCSKAGPIRIVNLKGRSNSNLDLLA